MKVDYAMLGIPKELRDAIKAQAKKVSRRTMIGYLEELVKADTLKTKRLEDKQEQKTEA